MQTSLSARAAGTPVAGARRSATRVPPAFGATTSRRTAVQVFAKKGKGKTASRGSMPGQLEAVRREVPTPEPDPENAEFVMFFRCLKYKDPALNMEVGPSLWVPLSIVKGNSVSNFLVQAIKSPWGMKLYGRTLIWQMSSGLYQDKAALVSKLRKEFPPFANASAKDFEFAFKIRDKANPKDWTKPEGLTVCPAQDVLGATGVDQLKKFWSVENLSSMFSGSDSTPATPAKQ